MEDEKIKVLLIKCITGEADTAEVKAVKHWMAKHPENEQHFTQLYETWQSTLLLNPGCVNEENAYQTFLAGVNRKAQANKYYVTPGKALLILAGLLVAAILIFEKVENTPLTYRTVQAKKGTTLKFTLTDGTLVYLNAGSKLKYQVGFGQNNRTVYLEGEAFFDIGHKVKNLPFIVKTQNYIIRDIGTRFNLRAYPNDPVFEATVIGGEVSVENNADSSKLEVNRIYLKPHQLLKIYTTPDKDLQKEALYSSDLYNEVQVTHVDSDKLQLYDGWKDNFLVFDGNTLAEIASVLSRRYDVDIKIESRELRNIRYSGSFKNITDINEVLHIIKENTPISYTIEGQRVTITKTY